jgi:2-polyprenyl-3-methyl-5-hydroxy-6-metoxy-1,4-benzoquinol methylase
MKYYYREHVDGYQRMRTEGKKSWDEIHGNPDGFENFSSRPFLEEVLPQLHFPVPKPEVLEYGCGTGPGACFLAERGFNVEGIDLIPTAIEIAKQLAKERNLDIHYEVLDVCKLPHEGKKYDMIVDSYCLQGIVTDEDREKVFAAVRARLKPEGYYLISTAMYEHEREYPDDKIADPGTGKAYSRYDKNALFAMDTEVYYDLFLQSSEQNNNPEEYEGTLRIDSIWYILKRRYRKPHTLKRELESHGFKVVYQSDGLGENVLCVL